MSKINKHASIKRIVNKNNTCNECNLDAVFRVKLTTVTKYKDGDHFVVKKTPHGRVDLCEGHLDEWTKENMGHLDSLRF